MIYTVTFNPSLDYRVKVEDFKIGEVNRTKEENIFPGGKGINVSMVLGNFGVSSVALGFRAGFVGEELDRMLKEKGVQSDLILVKNGCTRLNVKMKSDVETEINGRGPVIADADIDKLYSRLDLMQPDSILVLAGSIPDTMPKSIYMDIMNYLNVNHADKNIKVVVDATGDLLMNVLPHRPFLIKPNNHELGEIFGVELKTRESVIPYAKMLQEKGAQNVLVSLAGEGAVLLTEDGQIFSSAAPIGEVINSVGAGDSMVAGFLYGYLHSESWEEAFHTAVCTGSATAFSIGLATKEEVELLIRKTSLIL